MGTIISKAAVHLSLCRPTSNSDRRVHHVGTCSCYCSCEGINLYIPVFSIFLVLVLVMETNEDLFGDFWRVELFRPWCITSHFRRIVIFVAAPWEFVFVIRIV